ncbi:MAG: biopolymer transporter ExbD [Nitrospirae bacterium]|jgi:biopolymer transport protein ExbD|nr:biopolymer transporter ExbD [Nitrospirota bacterium]
MKLFSDHGEEERARIELIPMIDIMFFLLVVFIFISISLIKLNGVSLNLPKASSMPIQKKPQILNISIDKSGKLYVDKTPVNREGLQDILEKIVAQGLQTKEQIIVSGDKESRLQRLVDVMDLCNRMGFSNLSIRTDDKP